MIYIIVNVVVDYFFDFLCYKVMDVKDVMDIIYLIKIIMLKKFCMIV